MGGESRLRRGLLRAAGASLSLTAALAIVVLLAGEFDEGTARILGTTALISGFSLLTSPAGLLLDRDRARALAWGLAALCAAGFLISMVLVWGGSEDESLILLKSFVAVVAVAAALAQTARSLASLREADPPAVRSLFGLATALALIVAAMISFAAFAEVDDEFFYRLVGAAAVLDVLAVVMQPLQRRLGTRTGATTRHRLVCRLEGPAPGGDLGAGYRRREGDGSREVECEVDAPDFGAAARTVIDHLEGRGARVAGIDRLPAA